MATVTITLTISDTASGIQLTALTDLATGTTPVGVTLPAAFSSGVGGTWTYSFSSGDLQFSYVSAVTWPDATITPVNGLVNLNPAVADVNGQYSSLQDLYDEFGDKNIIQWSNLSNTVATVDTNRVQRALNYADSEINGTFMMGPYTEPLTPAVVGPTVRYWGAVIAGVKLYNARGQLDYMETGDGNRKPYNKYAGLLSKVYADMDRYKAGMLRMDSPRRWPVSSAPTASNY